VGLRGLSRIDGYSRFGVVGASVRPSSLLNVRERLIDCLLIGFFVVASYGATPLASFQVERWVWLGADFVALIIILRRSDEVLGQVRRNLVLISWPVLACASTLWSEAPAISLYHGIQLLLTVMVGLCLCMISRLERILVLLFLAFLTAAILSLAWVGLSQVPRSGSMDGTACFLTRM
jgi:hypothetical protein